ncbi:acetylxylan esterase [uncultured Devosia sp.]|uniref:acetylxylan esterase n=1 Tax=uncultured Devosia sp. TaxID=211434 RepID=UPI0035CBF3C0
MPFIDLSPAELLRYRSDVADPADFDDFWTQTLAETATIPLDARFEPIDVGLQLVDVFDASFAGFGGHPIKGWYIRPRGAAAGLSALVKFIGYNGGRGFAHEHLLWPATGRAVFVMDTRGQGSGGSHGETPDPVGSDPAHAGYMTRGIADPKSYFYRRVFTDAVRAVAALRTRPEVDADRVGAVGGSQGGGITLAVAGLVPDLRAAMPDVPFLCDFRRGAAIAVRGPYGEIVNYLSVHRDKADIAFRTLSYFDGVNFSRRAKAPALFSVGLMDAVCPASTVHGAYNVYAGPKAIETYGFNDHEGGGGFQERRQLDWLSAQGI